MLVMPRGIGMDEQTLRPGPDKQVPPRLGVTIMLSPIDPLPHLPV
jgi:hypothetical protein